MFKTIGIVLLMAVCLLPLYYEFPNKGNPVITFDNDKVNIHKNGLFIWEWENFCSAPVTKMGFDKELSYGANRNRIRSSVTIRTENPKVRKIFYEVKTYIDDLDLFYADKSRRDKYASGAQARINLLVERYLYDFNNSQSKNLEQFYNPLVEQQQEKFAQLLESWVNKRLKDTGLKINAGYFSII